MGSRPDRAPSSLATDRRRPVTGGPARLSRHHHRHLHHRHLHHRRHHRRRLHHPRRFRRCRRHRKFRRERAVARGAPGWTTWGRAAPRARGLPVCSRQRRRQRRSPGRVWWRHRGAPRLFSLHVSWLAAYPVLACAIGDLRATMVTASRPMRSLAISTDYAAASWDVPRTARRRSRGRRGRGRGRRAGRRGYARRRGRTACGHLRAAAGQDRQRGGAAQCRDCLSRLRFHHRLLLFVVAGVVQPPPAPPPPPAPESPLPRQ